MFTMLNNWSGKGKEVAVGVQISRHIGRFPAQALFQAKDAPLSH
jgi:hypothetical protein